MTCGCVFKLVIANADEDVHMYGSVYPGVFTSKAMDRTFSPLFQPECDRRKINRQVRKGMGAILERGVLGEPELCVFIVCSFKIQGHGALHGCKTDTLLSNWHFVIWGRLNLSCQVLQDLQQADSVAPPWQSCKNSRPRLFLIQVRNHFVSYRVFSLSFGWSRNNFGAPYPVSRTWRSDKMPSW